MSKTSGTRKTPDLLPILIERFGSRRLGQVTDLLLASPVIVMMIIVGFYFMFWQVDALTRLAHMIWVLGFWMLGTLGVFAFIIPARLNLGYPLHILLFAAMTIVLAVYFTPLFRFTTLFSSLCGLILPAVIGLINMLISWTLILRFRNKLSQS